MDWTIIVWLGAMCAILVLMGLVDDYYMSERRGWKPIVNFPVVWERIKSLFRRTS